MIVSLLTSLTRVTVTWYLILLIVLFVGDPAWAEAAYKRLTAIPGVPVFKMLGLQTAMKVQVHLLMYWTVPVLLAWVGLIFAGAAAAKLSVLGRIKEVSGNLKPVGTFGGVKVSSYSIGRLPQATTPGLEGDAVCFDVAGGSKKGGDIVKVAVRGKIKEAVLLLSPQERALAEDLLQLLAANPDHFAGLGHGVGLLEHTFNVLSEAAPRCTHDFRLPFIAALAHDIGKLVTFMPDGKGGWTRKGLHTREGARILATLPNFGELPDLHQSALMLAIKYDHAPSKMPMLRGDKEATMLAMRIINTLSAADKTATAEEKDRNLEKLQPEDIIWRDFVDNLRDANVFQSNGKRGGSNQLSLPANDKYVYLFEAYWREDAIKRLPAEMAAALDLTRRDSGKLAKYTNILVQVLRKEGLLVTEADTVNLVDGAEIVKRVSLPQDTALWDIRSGFIKDGIMPTGTEFRGILVLDRDLLWKKINYRINTVTAYKVHIIRPNAGTDGKVKKTVKQTKPSKATEARMAQPQSGLEVSDGQRIDINSDAMAAFGLDSGPKKIATRRARPGGEVVPPAPISNVAGLQDDVVAAGAAASPAAQSRSKVAGSFIGKVKAAFASGPHEAAPGEPEEAISSTEQNPLHENSQATSSTDFALAYFSAVGAPSESVAHTDAAKEALEPAANESRPETAKPSVPPKGSEAKPTAQPGARIPREVSLSNSERRVGIAIADEQACLLYPELVLGDKYYANASAGQVPGTKYLQAAGTNEAKAQRQREEQNKRQAQERSKATAQAQAKEKTASEVTSQAPAQAPAEAGPPEQTANQPTATTAPVTQNTRVSATAPAPQKHEKQRQPQAEAQSVKPAAQGALTSTQSDRQQQGSNPSATGQQAPQPHKTAQSQNDKSAQQRERQANTGAAQDAAVIGPAATLKPVPPAQTSQAKQEPAGALLGTDTMPSNVPAQTDTASSSNGQVGAPKQAATQSVKPQERAGEAAAEGQSPKQRGPNRGTSSSPLVSPKPSELTPSLDGAKPKKRRSFS